MSKIRSFFAIELKSKLILDKIERYQRKLQKSIGPLKLVNRSLIHLTLRFLGDIDNETAKKLYNFMETEINNKYFNPEDEKIGILKGVGDFNKRVFFIRILGVKELLQEIYEKINKKTQSFPEIKLETKPYTPHLTIARSKRQSHHRSRQNQKSNPGQLPYPQLKSQYKEFEFGKWNIEKVVLKKSVLTPTGPIYSNLEY
ncbi:RNA 2',3'-cyclic phosphodiesterase [Promethearchaeum syntrophicum]|uniref:RNA 2',3'-cyclic phosphodiesterase n=1 Tax=Promethearchaeum syntrophicum TaxID=2594042 RepID=A0A5B9DCV8_9ARCH|nr:RNA 2',3'-cyclic phosphodiesterase [Candidatus Prometheoarchaeum syntrophicum]